MKLSLFLAVALPVSFYGQDSLAAARVNDYPNTFSSGSAKIEKFDNSSRKFKDWAISLGGGPAFTSHSDLTSRYDGKMNWGWNAYASIDKQLTHTFGLNLQYQMGETNQRGKLPGAEGVKAGVAKANTEYKHISLLGDINFSNLLRRVDNHSSYRWALHGYAGVGFQGYKTLLLDNDLSQYVPNTFPIAVDQKLDFNSLFFQGGVGLKFNASKLIDLELRTMYVISGDDEFDGGGDLHDALNPRINYNLINPAASDNLFTVNLGLSLKLGKQKTHLAWYDPMQEVYYRAFLLEKASNELIVCTKGDKDNDGVCDDWDRQIDTPAGARVDGAGVALDMDLDGVIDLNDKCVTVPGIIDNNGCPGNQTVVK